MKPETTKLALDKSRSIKLSTGEHVCIVDAWACGNLREEIIHRFNDYERLKRIANERL